MLPFPTGLFSRFGAALPGFFEPSLAAVLGAIAVLHVTGAAASFARLAGEGVRTRSVCRRSAAVEVAGFADLSRQAGLSRLPEVRVSSEVPVPCALGGRRPAILLPRPVFEGVSGRALRLILAHELAHLRRRDPLREAAESVVASVWWFNPLLRVLIERRRELREERCDADVLRSAPGCGREYSLALLSVASLAPPGRRARAVAATGTRSHLERRLRRIADGRPGGGGPIRRAVLIAAAVLFLLPGVRPDTASSAAVPASAQRR
jgi:beta-lactamase regulating signal transducer with metallopeptidase domain